MTSILVFIGAAVIVLVAAGGIALGAVLALHQLALLRVPGRDDVVEQSLADFMVDPVPVAEPEHPLDRLARHCDVKIVGPSHDGARSGPVGAARREAGHTTPRSASSVVVPPLAGEAREAASHAEKGTR
jgi:hypothetical protein